MLLFPFLFGFLIGNGLGLMVRAITGVYRLAACTGLAVVAGIANAVAGAPGVGHFFSIVWGVGLGAALGYGAGQFVELRPSRPTLGGIAAGYGRFIAAQVRRLVLGPALPGGQLQPGAWTFWPSRGKKVAAVAVWLGGWWLVSSSFYWQRSAGWIVPAAFLLGLALYLEGVQSGILAALHSRTAPPALPRPEPPPSDYRPRPATGGDDNLRSFVDTPEAPSSQASTS
jgi:hypothetical protein